MHLLPPYGAPGTGLGSATQPWRDVVLDGALRDPDGHGATPADLRAHLDSTANPHAVTAAQALAVALDEKGTPGGVATLGTDGRVPSAQLPDGLPPTAHGHTLADVADAGGAAALDVGLAPGTVAAGDHAHAGIYDPAGTGAAASAAAVSAHEATADHTLLHAHANRTALDTLAPATPGRMLVVNAEGDGYAEAVVPAGGTGGDMLMSVYDANADGKVDTAAAADALTGVESAGAARYYGTDNAGAAGFHALPTGGTASMAGYPAADTLSTADGGVPLVATVEPDGTGARTSLLLHSDGADASTVFTDASVYAHEVATHGDAQLDSAHAVFGGASASFSGSGAYLHLAASADFRFGTGDFCLDGWVRREGGTTVVRIVGTGGEVRIGCAASGTIIARAGTVTLESTGAVSTTFRHVCFCRRSGVAYLFLDGVLEDLAACGTDFSGNAELSVGAAAGAAGEGGFDALSQTARSWRGLTATPGGDVLACAYGGDIFRQSGGSGPFVALGQAARDWTGLAAAPNGDVYACVYSGDIYLQSGGTGDFVALGQGTANWSGLAAAPNGDVYACALGGDMYRRVGGTGNFVALGQTALQWLGLSVGPEGDVYACVHGGDIYEQAGGTGNFLPLGQTSRAWAAIAATPNGDVYAGTYGGDVYRRRGGAGDFLALNQTLRNWRSMAATASGDVYAGVDPGDIYRRIGLQEFCGHIDELRVSKGTARIDDPLDRLFIPLGEPEDGFDVPTAAYGSLVTRQFTVGKAAASAVAYDPATSGLLATDAQAALDELAALASDAPEGYPATANFATAEHGSPLVASVVGTTKTVAVADGSLPIRTRGLVYGDVVTLTDGATIATNGGISNRFQVTLGATGRTLANPSNMRAGAEYLWIIRQDATGGRTITSWGSAFDFGDAGLPTLSTGAGKVDMLVAYCTGTVLRASLLKGFSA